MIINKITNSHQLVAKNNVHHETKVMNDDKRKSKKQESKEVSCEVLYRESIVSYQPLDPSVVEEVMRALQYQDGWKTLQRRKSPVCEKMLREEKRAVVLDGKVNRDQVELCNLEKERGMDREMRRKEEMGRPNN
jgi:hypothetical protein